MHETTVMTSKDLLIISEALSHYSIGHLDKADRIVVGMMNDNWPADTQTGSYFLRKGPLFRYHFKRLRAGADRKTRSIGFFHPGSLPPQNNLSKYPTRYFVSSQAFSLISSGSISTGSV